MKLMIVESPNKVDKISSLLGSGWTVAASVGHICDLPEHEVGVSAPDYRPEYQFTERGKRVVAKLQSIAARADAVYLATDPDREGEAIAWHVAEALHLRNARRVTFNCITAAAIQAALSSPRDINIHLVRAQEARRVLDRLVGYKVSPVLCHLLKERTSAGRVQTPAVRLIVEREREIVTFQPTRHFLAKLSFDGGQWTADWITKPFLKDNPKYILDERLAKTAASIRTLTVKRSNREDVNKSPPPAFTTATLLQAASAKLRYKPAQTANIAQALFEQGLITYHRTDSQNLSDEAVADIRDYAKQHQFPLTDAPRKWGSKRDAQEAHEAIRPTHLDVEAGGSTTDERALYDLIRKRALASQLADAIYSTTTIELEGRGGGLLFHYSAHSRVLKFKGWKAVTPKDATDEDDSEEEPPGNLPQPPAGSTLRADKGEVLAKISEPSSRYSQASVIKKLEQLGIGRPSTYASIITNIITRGYVEEEKSYVHPTDKAFRAIDALKGAFGFVEYDFTRDVEVKLDHVASGSASYLDVVQQVDRQIQKELGQTGVNFSEMTGATTAQLDLARKLAETLGESIPANVLGDRRKLGEWLTKAKNRSSKASEDRMRAEPASGPQISVIQRAVDAGRIEKPAGWPTIDKMSASQLIEKIIGEKKASSGKFRRSKRR